MTRVTDVSFGTKNREYFEFKSETIYASVYVGGVVIAGSVKAGSVIGGSVSPVPEV